MKIEHVAFNVPDPVAAARWYVDHLGFTIKRRFVEPPYGHFLADDSGTVMVELYKRTDAPVPDYPAQHPAVLHLALVSRDVDADVRGARLFGMKTALVRTGKFRPEALESAETTPDIVVSSLAHFPALLEEDLTGGWTP